MRKRVLTAANAYFIIQLLQHPARRARPEHRHERRRRHPGAQYFVPRTRAPVSHITFLSPAYNSDLALSILIRCPY